MNEKNMTASDVLDWLSHHEKSLLAQLDNTQDVVKILHLTMAIRALDKTREALQAFVAAAP